MEVVHFAVSISRRRTQNDSFNIATHHRFALCLARLINAFQALLDHLLRQRLNRALTGIKAGLVLDELFNLRDDD